MTKRNPIQPGATARRVRPKKLYASMLLVGVMGGAPWAFTHAIFTDEETNASVFASGILDISDSPADAVITKLNMAPGDKVTAPLTLSNDGTLDLRYSMDTAVEGASDDAALLAQTMELTIRQDVADCSDAGFSASGSLVDSGPLDAAAIGDRTQGGQAGDREIAVGGEDVLCFQAELPLSAGNVLQDEKTTTTFTFYAEQLANNI